MENITIRKYQDGDKNEVEKLFNDFITYLNNLDPLHRVVSRPDYGQKYLVKTAHEVKEKNGIFLVADFNGKIIGMGAGVVNKLTEEDLLETPLHTPGRITELYVDAEFRGRGIGSKIMEVLEADLIEKGCNTIHVEVFAPNTRTHELYKKLGYVDRNIDTLKIVKR